MSGGGVAMNWAWIFSEHSAFKCKRTPVTLLTAGVR